MKKNKNQALYKCLPGSWMEYTSDDNRSESFVAKVLYWNSIKALDVHEDKIKRDILHKIKTFEQIGGDTSEFNRVNLEEILEVVEAKMDENFPDIQVAVEPRLFYCNECGRLKYASSSDISMAPRCDVCNKRMKQIPFVYVCECGHAESIRPLRGYDISKIRYRPASKIGDKSNYHFKILNGAVEATKEMIEQCECGNWLKPTNATDNKVLYAQTGKCVNLLDEKLKHVYSTYGESTDFLVLAKWLGIIEQEKYNSVLKNPEPFFNPDTSLSDETIKQFVDQGFDLETVKKILALSNSNNINAIKEKINSELASGNYSKSKLDAIVSQLYEFDTIKNPKSKIDISTAGLKLVESGQFDSIHEIIDLNARLGISNIQVSHDIRIVNYTYAYTRKAHSPEVVTGGKPLKLKPFAQSGKYKVYSSKLDTEGLLIEFDRKKLYEFLEQNQLINYKLNLDSEKEEKKFFMEKIDSSEINHFSSINPAAVETKAIYSLLHTISHLLIKSAGINSGLSKEDFAEIIFPSIPAIFIYSTTEQGLVLGSISGMFETNYRKFILDAFQEFETCSFDPICSTHHDGSCLACTMLGEVGCEHFNKDLSRKYLYGGVIKEEWSRPLSIKKGFWK